LSSFCLAWFIARCCFSSTQLIPLDSHQNNQWRLITLVLPYHHFESTLPFSSWSFYHYNSNHRNQLRYAASKHIFSLYHLKTLLILLACDVAPNPALITINFCNIWSIRNKSALIFDYIHCNAPDIFGVSETHLSPHESASLIQDFTPPDYNFFIYTAPTVLAVVLGASSNRHLLVQLYQLQSS
jgi:hypothetical protein